MARGVRHTGEKYLGKGHNRKKILESEARIFGERRHTGRNMLEKECTQEENIGEGSTHIWGKEARRRKKI